MQSRRSFVLCALLLVTGSQSLDAASTVTTLHGPNPNFDHTLYDDMISNTDVIQGLIATELVGDLGWHPANPASSNSSHENGLPNLTDGRGGFDIFAGLMNDFPGEGTPTKLLQFDLDEPTNIGGINILAGNANGVDGRIFTSMVIRYSTDNGETFAPLGGYVPDLGVNSNGYYASDVPTTINRPGGSNDSPENLETLVTFMSIFDDASAVMAIGVTNLQFDFYASNNSDGWERDAFDGVNPFTGFDDLQPPAISSPLIWEIDVLEGPEVSADFDADGDVDGIDFLEWQVGNSPAPLSQEDLGLWLTAYPSGGGAIQAVPEPTACFLIGAFALAALQSRSCWRS